MDDSSLELDWFDAHNEGLEDILAAADAAEAEWVSGNREETQSKTRQQGYDQNQNPNQQQQPQRKVSLCLPNPVQHRSKRKEKPLFVCAI